MADSDWILSPISQLPDRLLLPSDRPSSSSSSSSSSTSLFGIVEDLDFLRRTWPRIQAVLCDAEEIEIVNVSVRRWLRELKDLAHDAEDLLDDYEYAMAPRLDRRKDAARWKMLYFSIWFQSPLVKISAWKREKRLRMLRLRNGDELKNDVILRLVAKMIRHLSNEPMRCLPKRISSNTFGSGFVEYLFLHFRWRDLEKIAHDAHDVFGEHEYEMLRAEVLASDGLRRLLSDLIDQDAGYWLRTYFGTIEGVTATPPSRATMQKKCNKNEVFNSSSSSLLNKSSWEAISRQVREIRKRFDEIAKQRDTLHLREGDGERRFEVPKRPQTVSLISAESHICGREHDKKKLVELLLSSEHNVSVITLTGIGGIGKTTLAQLIYNKKKIRKHFDARGWISVSEEFDLVKLTKAAIGSMMVESCQLSTEYQHFTQLDSLDALQGVLINMLKGNKFLVVLDDVWNENQELWETLLVPFKHGSKGSKILLTTRIEHVSHIVRSRATHCLGLLSDNDCWELFQWHAFDGRDPIDENTNLVAIGLEIVKKCKGLPLAAKVLGQLLGSKSTDEGRWKEILDSHIWDIEEGKIRILAPLRLSYNYLPMHLKQCFLYSSLYPKDYQFDKDELVRLWMAQGLVQAQRRKQIEDVGNEFFEYLLWRSFFQQIDICSGESKFVMHDLMHDLAQHILQEEHSLIKDDAYPSSHHLQLLPDDFKRTTNCQAPYESRIGRTFLKHWYPQIQTKVEYLHKYKYLRVLDLHAMMMEKLPDSIGDLKCLRYLGLRFNLITELPASTCYLYKLMTLDLCYCRRLESLPEGIGNLKNLRHLFVNTYSTQKVFMPSGIGQLTNLQTLDWFHVRRTTFCGETMYVGLTELKHLGVLRGELRITGLYNVTRGEDASTAKLNDKEHLSKLILDWSSYNDKACMPEVVAPEEEKVLENLRPHSNLIELQIKGYHGVVFPGWLGDQSFSNLSRIEVYDCINCEVLPGLGQLPSLKYVELSGLSYLKRVEDGEFPSLRRLGVKDCPMLFDHFSADASPDLPSFLLLPNRIFQYLGITGSPFLSDWCRRHACAELKHIVELVLDGNQFYYPRQNDRTFRSVPNDPRKTSVDYGTSQGSGFTSSTISDASRNSLGRSPLLCFSQRTNNLRAFTSAELKTATNNFSRSLTVGKGRLGCVYRGTIKSFEDPRTKVEIAVKQFYRRLQGHWECLALVNFLGVVDHPNLVKLIGYCAEDDERGVLRHLIYEFMPNRSVLDHLSTRSAKPLPWSMRLRIAFDAARGLTYLHEEMGFQIIFQDFKTSNILLDEHWNAKLSDFGLARHRPTEGLSHVSTAFGVTIGYAAPEYMQTRSVTVKSDIWSYGVVLYELITGRLPLDMNRPKGEQKLLEWVKPYISNIRKFHMIIDPRLGGQYSLKSAQQLAAVANKCLGRHPKSRPKMSEVLEMVKGIVESAETGSPKPPSTSSDS